MRLFDVCYPISLFFFIWIHMMIQMAWGHRISRKYSRRYAFWIFNTIFKAFKWQICSHFISNIKFMIMIKYPVAFEFFVIIFGLKMRRFHEGCPSAFFGITKGFVEKAGIIIMEYSVGRKWRSRAFRSLHAQFIASISSIWFRLEFWAIQTGVIVMIW